MKERFSFQRPKKPREKIAAQAALVFDSFRQPMLAGMRASSGRARRQLLYKAGRYTIKLQVEPGAGEERLSIIGQILDDKTPSGGNARHRRARAPGKQDAGPDGHEPARGDSIWSHDAAGRLQLSRGRPEIGTFTVEPPRGRRRARRRRTRTGKAAEGSVAARKARPR
jgi:hypothetical protein